jgi:3-hydroxyisobutyrate dehydrogenase-like beta-hydroxyacid dehydrogenase
VTALGKSIGIAGCGAMGLPMAQNLLNAGYDVWGYDVRPVSEFGEFEHRMISDPAVFADRVEIVFSVVRDWRQTQDLCFDNQAVFVGANHPGTLIISSTLSPRVLSSLSKRIPDDVVIVDAPMSGAPYRAQNASLTFMVGGADDTVEELTPAFNVMGEEVHHLGPLGAGMACKVVNNFVAASSVVAVRHALKSASALGIDQKTILQIMRTSSGGTWFGDNFGDIDWAGEGYEPSNTIGILDKDMAAYLDALEALPGRDITTFEQAVIDGLRTMEVISE